MNLKKENLNDILIIMTLLVFFTNVLFINNYNILDVKNIVDFTIEEIFISLSGFSMFIFKSMKINIEDKTIFVSILGITLVLLYTYLYFYVPNLKISSLIGLIIFGYFFANEYKLAISALYMKNLNLKEIKKLIKEKDLDSLTRKIDISKNILRFILFMKLAGLLLLIVFIFYKFTIPFIETDYIYLFFVTSFMWSFYRVSRSIE